MNENIQLINTSNTVNKYNPNKINIFMTCIILLSLIISVINVIYILKFNYIVEQIIPYKNKLITLLDIACNELKC